MFLVKISQNKTHKIKDGGGKSKQRLQLWDSEVCQGGSGSQFFMQFNTYLFDQCFNCPDSQGCEHHVNSSIRIAKLCPVCECSVLMQMHVFIYAQ